MIDLEAARFRWHPIAASDDLVQRHVFHAQVLGRELAVWRADNGQVNAWENRCLHRGVRLSIGVNDGSELICQYHGWRYANGTAGCTYIPAHPADAPARTICNNTYPVREQFGLVWSGETPEGDIDCCSELNHTFCTPLRSITINTALHHIALPLISRYQSIGTVGLHGIKAVHYGADTPDPYQIILRAFSDKDTHQQAESLNAPDIAFFLQPVDASRTTLRGLLCGIDQRNTSAADLTNLLRQHDNILCQLRDRIEADNRHVPLAQPWVPLVRPVSEAFASMPERQSSGRKAALRLQVSAIEPLSSNVSSFTLNAIHTANAQEASLPVAQPGAHIDVHLQNAMIRQYSIINGPGESDHYTIAVKKLDNSTGGSKAIHESLKVGDIVATSVPRNNFPLRRDAEHTVLVAGGIGITPLLSMARALNKARLPFSFHHFVSTESDRLFIDELQQMNALVEVHIGLDPQDTQAQLSELLKTPVEHQHVYLCGPGPMLAFARQYASENGWPDTSIHVEFFKNTEMLDDSRAFTVELARSGLSLDVPAGTSLLSVLNANNVGVPSSCEQGACGTCRVVVLEGQPDHQDVHLSDAEKAQNNCLMSCVSRACSDRLVLDL